jgi:hypothetical protein
VRGTESNTAGRSHLTNPALVMASLNSYDNLGRAVFKAENEAENGSGKRVRTI